MKAYVFSICAPLQVGIAWLLQLAIGGGVVLVAGGGEASDGWTFAVAFVEVSDVKVASCFGKAILVAATYATAIPD